MYIKVYIVNYEMEEYKEIYIIQLKFHATVQEALIILSIVSVVYMSQKTIFQIKLYFVYKNKIIFLSRSKVN